LARGSSFHALANPARFLRLANAVLPFAKALAAAALAAGLVLGLYVAPPDYQQGEAYRIMFVHVPSAWMALLLYALIALLSAAFLIWKHPLAAMLARAAAPVGAVFTLINLVSGALWGKPMWGAYWVWDARLTSVLVLFLMYLGVMALWPIADTYIDDDVSAYSGKPRPEYRRLLDDMRAGTVDAVVVWHLDRLHRHPRELEEFFDVHNCRFDPESLCAE